MSKRRGEENTRKKKRRREGGREGTWGEEMEERSG